MKKFYESFKKKFNSLHKTPKPVVFVLIGLLVFLLFVNYVYYQAILRSRAAIGVKVSLSFDPASGTTPLSSTIKGKVLETSVINVTGYGFKVNFDKTKAKVTSLTYNFGSVAPGLGDDGSTSNLTDINNRGYITVRGQIQTAGGQTLGTSQTPIVTIGFAIVPDYVTPSTVTIDTANGFFNKSDSSGIITSTDISVEGSLALNGGSSSSSSSSGGSSSSSSSSGGSSSSSSSGSGGSSSSSSSSGGSSSSSSSSGGGGNATLNLKLKFQGILKKPADEFNNFKVKVTAVSGIGIESAGSATFTANDNGIWSGSVKLDIRPEDKFKVFAKGPKHLQKRICTATPTETFDGTYHCEQGAIALKEGENDLDFKGIYLLVGDLPNNGVQDGIVNAYDVSIVRNNVGTTAPSVLAIADLNLDGIVDTQDYSLVIAALSIRADEGK